MSSQNLSRRARLWLVRTTLALMSLGATSAWAQVDPPGRVGRLAEVQGSVSWFDDERGVWGDAERNRPLTSGDRVSTGPRARAELRVGSTVLRLAASTELEVLTIDDERMSFQLHTGSLALRVRSREVADEIDIVTAEARLRPLRAGHYRFDRSDETTHAGAWLGTLRIDDIQGLTIETGQRMELWREGRERQALRYAPGTLPNDEFADWVARDDARDGNSASSQYVSPEMTGAEDLDRNGRWEQHAEYGALWFPLEVRAGWAPYRYGRWAWVSPWGWTWVDEANWGFAPFHYGRWVNWRGRWGWAPGEYVVRPIYAPALVAWVGGPNFGISINIGGPTVGWVPLAPREWYTPVYRHTPVYGDRINHHRPGRDGPGPRPPRQGHSGPVVYGNQGVPGGVTVVPRDVLLRREPVTRGFIDGRDARGPRAQQPLVVAPPPQREARDRIRSGATRVRAVIRATAVMFVIHAIHAMPAAGPNRAKVATPRRHAPHPAPASPSPRQSATAPAPSPAAKKRLRPCGQRPNRARRQRWRPSPAKNGADHAPAKSPRPRARIGPAPAPAAHLRPPRPGTTHPRLQRPLRPPRQHLRPRHARRHPHHRQRPRLRHRVPPRRPNPTGAVIATPMLAMTASADPSRANPGAIVKTSAEGRHGLAPWRSTPYFNRGCSTGHTLASKVGWASALGWMRSLWNSASALGASATPASKKGTSAAPSARATVPNSATSCSP